MYFLYESMFFLTQIRWKETSMFLGYVDVQSQLWCYVEKSSFWRVEPNFPMAKSASFMIKSCIYIYTYLYSLIYMCMYIYIYTWKLLRPFFLVLSEKYLFFGPFRKKNVSGDKKRYRVSMLPHSLPETALPFRWIPGWSHHRSDVPGSALIGIWGPLSCYVNSWSIGLTLLPLLKMIAAFRTMNLWYMIYVKACYLFFPV